MIKKRVVTPEDKNWNDPRNMDGQLYLWPMNMAYGFQHYPDNAFVVHGWNDMPKGGACHYGHLSGTFKECIEWAKKFVEDGHDDHPTDPRSYDHYSVIEQIYQVRVSQKTHFTIDKEDRDDQR